jgi:hypothetical protein
MPSTDSRFQNAEGDIWQHMVNNSDWDYQYLLYNSRLSSTCCLRKDGYRLAITSRLSGLAIFSAIRLEDAKQVSEDPDIYEIVLSFAGEDREYVERVAAYLRERDVRCFYDRYENVTLWGKDLGEHIHKVYSSARFYVMFISRSYAEKVWTTHERRSALERAIQERGEYILPARFDDTEIPGLRRTIGYVDLRDKTPEELGAMIIRKLGRRHGARI